MSDYIKICLNCKRTNSKEYPTLAGFYDVFKIPSDNICYFCGNKLIDSEFTEEEFKIIKKISYNKDFLQTMIELKEKDIIEYTAKLSQFKSQVIEQKNNETDNRPKCPTCNSTNIEKISVGKKAVGGFMFGLLSSDVRKTMHCKNCGYKW